MKVYTLLISLNLIAFLQTFSHENCVCKALGDARSMDTSATNLDEHAEWAFSESFSTESVRGVLQAMYYYCDEEHGLLVVHSQNKVLIYKDVPLRIWFEFKFAESVDDFYREQIKYQFILHQFQALSPNLGDTQIPSNVQ